MKNAIDLSLQTHPHPYISDDELAILLNGSPDSRYSKVKRLLAQEKLVHIRRGLYCLGDKLGRLLKPHPLELAQYIYGPSYISLESALSFHKLIPETVYTITSATSKRAKEFQTPLGLFSYLHLPPENLYLEVELIKEKGYSFLMAKPWKAICDYVYCTKKDWKNLEPLLESLRIDPANLPLLRNHELQALDEYYQHKRISHFLKGIPS